MIWSFVITVLLLYFNDKVTSNKTFLNTITIIDFEHYILQENKYYSIKMMNILQTLLVCK